LVNGKKIFASLSGAADYYGVLCTERAEGETASQRNTLYLAIPAGAEGVSVVGDWNPLGMRGTVSRTLLLKDVFVPEQEMLMPRGVYFEAAIRWPYIFLTLSPTYMGLAQAAYDFTIQYLRDEMPGTPPVQRRTDPTKQIAVAEMHIMLEQTKALLVPSDQRSAPESKQGAGIARLCSATHGNEECQCPCRQSTAYLRRPGNTQVAPTRAHLS
jgi:alkylation response protein AidB-like acyl-CoA dehydrogenase